MPLGARSFDQRSGPGQVATVVPVDIRVLHEVVVGVVDLVDVGTHNVVPLSKGRSQKKNPHAKERSISCLTGRHAPLCSRTKSFRHIFCVHRRRWIPPVILPPLLCRPCCFVLAAREKRSNLYFGQGLEILKDHPSLLLGLSGKIFTRPSLPSLFLFIFVYLSFYPQADILSIECQGKGKILTNLFFLSPHLPRILGSSTTGFNTPQEGVGIYCQRRRGLL